MAEQHMLTIISDIPILYNKRNNIILLWRKVGLNHIWTFSLTNLKDDISLWIAALADSPDIAVPGFRETERETPREREREGIKYQPAPNKVTLEVEPPTFY